MNMKQSSSNDFNFWLPIDIEKSSGSEFERGDDRRYENMVFEGIASDNSVDYEGDSMEPDGFEISSFLKHGLFNLDHLTSRAKELKSRFWIGEPLDGKIIQNEFWVKGRLWKRSPEARAFWDKCIEMRESGSSRKPGMSIEGKALGRDPKNAKHIIKAIVNNIALTMTPVNYNSYLDLVKGIQKEDFVQNENLINSQLKSKIMFEHQVGNKMITIDSNFNVHEKQI